MRPHNSAGQSGLGTVLSCEGQRGLAPVHTSEQSTGKQLWAPPQAAHERQLGPWSRANTSREPAQAALASAPSHSRARVPVEEKTHLKRIKLARADPPGFCSSNLGSDPYPDRAIMATGQRGHPTSYLAPALAPPSPATSPTRVIAASTPQRWNLCPRQIQLSHQRVSHIRTPL